MTIAPTDTLHQAVRNQDWPEAERLARLRLKEQPEGEEYLFMLAISLTMQGRPMEASTVHAELTRLRPQEPIYWSNYATVLREAGSLDEALAAQQEALRLAPDDATQLTSTALLLLDKGEHAAAQETMQLALKHDPASPRVRIQAARTCEVCRKHEEVEALLEPWRTWLPLEEDLQIELGDLLLSNGDGSDAVVVFEDLVRRGMDNPRALVHLASAYERLNRVDDAQAVILRLRGTGATSNPVFAGEIAHVVARIAQRNGDLEQAADILESTGPRSDADFAHYFSLAQIRDRQGDTEAAMRGFARAHELQLRDLRKFVPARFEPGASILPLADRRIELEDAQRWPELVSPDAKQSPVFIVGFPRSGTTLLEQMLDAHPAFQSMDENPFFNRLAEDIDNHGIDVPRGLARLGQRDCDELRRRYLDMVCATIQRRWDTQLVDKNPLNMLWLPLIHRLFPHAKYILAIRHPCDVVLSCYMQNFKAPLLASACTELERVARAYVASMDNWLHHVGILRPDVLVLRNEDLVADTPGEVARLAAFLGLDDAAALLSFDDHARRKGFIGTPSYTQVVQPVNAKGVNRWQAYRGYFDSVLPILQPMLRQWNYDAGA